MTGEVGRMIDRLPEPSPSEKRKLKVIVASTCRNGTLSVHHALEKLGYKSYHALTSVRSGVEHMKILEEAIEAHNNRWNGIPKYTRRDFNKWWAEYDCVCELASYFGTDVLEAYAEDPEVKFILTERDPDRWVTSVTNTSAQVVERGYSFPWNVLKYFDGFLYHVIRMNAAIYWTCSNGTMPGDPSNRECMRRFYTEYNERAKRIMPADRTLIVNIEDGLGWDDLCPFLDTRIPNEAWPDSNDSASFNRAASVALGSRYRCAALRLGVITAPIVGLVVWAMAANRSALSGLVKGASWGS